MRDLQSWNIPLGRWAGVQVRLHVFFVLFAIVAVHLGARDHMAETVSVLGLLFVSVLIHELSHCWAAWRLGGSADQILIWPLGGLAQINMPREPHHELAVALAGPLANFLLCAMVAPLIWAVGEEGPKQLLASLRLVPPAAVADFGWADLLRWTFWINWLLLLVNLLPAFPLDGGRAFRCLLRPKCGLKKSVLIVSLVAEFMAVGLGIAAWSAHGSTDYSFAALPLLLLGLLLFFSAKQEADRLRDSGDFDDAPFGYDFSQGYTSLERTGASNKPSPGLVRNWIDERRAARRLRQQQIEADEERRVDDVLARLHESGLHVLSEEDRALLDRVSARYRNRQRG